MRTKNCNFYNRNLMKSNLIISYILWYEKIDMYNILCKVFCQTLINCCFVVILYSDDILYWLRINFGLYVAANQLRVNQANACLSLVVQIPRTQIMCILMCSTKTECSCYWLVQVRLSRIIPMCGTGRLNGREAKPRCFMRIIRGNVNKDACRASR